jgi:hypothetical protein
MLQAFSAQNRPRTFMLLVAAALLALAAGLVGISDNPLGISLAMLAAGGLVLAFNHMWRISRQFRRLIYASLTGFVTLMAAGMALQAVVEFTSAPRLVDTLLGVVSTVFLLVAGFLCIPAFVVGVIGALVMHSRQKRPRSTG